MITDLHISNYALIDSIDLTFGPGLNINCSKICKNES